MVTEEHHTEDEREGDQYTGKVQKRRNSLVSGALGSVSMLLCMYVCMYVCM